MSIEKMIPSSHLIYTQYPRQCNIPGAVRVHRSSQGPCRSWQSISSPLHRGLEPTRARWAESQGRTAHREALAGYNGLLFSKTGILKTARHAVSFPNSGGNPDQLWLWAFHTLMSLLCLQCPWDHEYSWAGEERMHTHDPVDRSGSWSGKTQKDTPRDLTPSDVFWRAAS